jgi:hypothetical protein
MLSYFFLWFQSVFNLKQFYRFTASGVIQVSICIIVIYYIMIVP